MTVEISKYWVRLLGLFCALFLLGLGTVRAQTPGQIYQSAEGKGRLILDPNGDGYVSANETGFSTNDVTESEISFFALPVLEPEPLNDVRTGANGGHTDLASLGSTHASGGYMYYDGTNVIFRVRLAGQSKASKGYSFLFNTDFSAFGPKGENFTATNPGFQFEVVLETGKGVSIYTLDGDKATLAKKLTEDGHSQKSLSYTISDGSGGYFYDFYVPLAEIEKVVPGFSFSTGFRVAMATITRAQSGITGTLSDINGINDTYYRDVSQALINIIDATSSSTLSDISLTGGGFGSSFTNKPGITTPLVAGDIRISGTSVEADGTLVTVYVSGNSGSRSYSTTVGNNEWTVAVTSLSEGEQVTAEADAVDKELSEQAGPFTVYAEGEQCTDTPLNVSRSGNDLGGTIPGLPAGTTSASLVIRLYDPDGKLYLSTDISDGAPESGTFNFISGEHFSVGGRGNPFSGGAVPADFLVTAQLAGQCESDFSERLDGDMVQTDAPVITTDLVEVTSSAQMIEGRAVAGATVWLYREGVSLGTATADGFGDWAITIAGNTFVEGDIIYARAQAMGEMISQKSNTKKVGEDAGVLEQSLPPVITGSYTSVANATITGYTSEGAGTEIRILVNGSTIAQTQSDAFGNWQISGIDLSNNAGHDIIARATAAGEMESEPSEPVTIQMGTTAPPTIFSGVSQKLVSEIIAGGSITGTGSGTIRIYIDGQLAVDNIAFNVSLSAKTVDGDTLANLIEHGVEIYATAQDAGSIESATSNVVTVLPDPLRYISVKSVTPDPVPGGGGQKVTVTFVGLTAQFTPAVNAPMDITLTSGKGALDEVPTRTDENGEIAVSYITAKGDDGKTVSIKAVDSASEADPHTAILSVQEMAPEVRGITLGSDGGDNIALTFVTDKALGGAATDLSVEISGPNNGTNWPISFDRNDFAETDNGDGSFTYLLTTARVYNDGAGKYTATIMDALDSGGRDGADGSQKTVYTFTADNIAPTVSNVILGNNERRLTLNFQSNELLGSSLSDVAVNVDGPGTKNIYLFDRGDFIGTLDKGEYIYTLIADSSVFYSEGSGVYTARIVDAKDAEGNDGGDGTVTGTYTLDIIPRKMVMVSGDNQKQPTLSVLGDPLVVRLLDEFGKPVPGYPVTFGIAQVPDGADSAAFSPSESLTDENGFAYSSFRLGDVGGSYRMSVKAEGLADSVSFTATAMESKPNPAFIDTVNTVVFKGDPNAFIYAEPSASLDELQDLTVEIWLLPNAVEGSYTIMEKGSNADAAEKQISISGNGNTVQVELFTTDGKTISLSANSFFAEEEGEETVLSKMATAGSAEKTKYKWTHLALSVNREEGKARLYRNGFSVDESTYDGELNRGSQRMTIGSGYDGEIHEIRVWDTARNQSKIQAHMTRLLNGNEQNLVLYHTFDEEDKDRDTDLTSKGNHLFRSGDVQRNFSIRGIPNIEMFEDDTYIMAFKGLDENGNSLEAIITSMPGRGRLYQLAEDGEVGEQITTVPTILTDEENRAYYQPDPYYFGEDEFRYALRDPFGNRADALRKVTVHPVNNGPQVNFVNENRIEFDQRDTLRLKLTNYVKDVDNSFDELSWQARVLEDNEQTGSKVAANLTGEAGFRKALSKEREGLKGDLYDYEVKTGPQPSKAGGYNQRWTVATIVQKSSSTSKDSLVIEIDSRKHEAVFTTTPNFYASNIPVFFEASDLGRKVGGDTLWVTVKYKNGPPSPFHQLLPSDRDTVFISDVAPSVSFNWEKSSDIEGQKIEYIFKVRREDGVEKRVEGISDTTLSFDRSDSFIELDKNYEWRVWATDGVDTTASATKKGLVITKDIPLYYQLSQNYPNPFNPTTKIQYWVPVESKVKITLYNILGQRVAILVDGTVAKGLHVIDLDANGLRLASGLYIYRMEAESIERKLRFIKTRKFTLIK